jgi:hypothetical protein
MRWGMKGIKEKILLIHFEALKRPLTVPIPKAGAATRGAWMTCGGNF